MKVISDYIDLISTEIDVDRSEVEVIINLFPESIKTLPKFNDAMQDKSWSASIKTSITSFDTAVNYFHHTLVPIVLKYLKHDLNIIVVELLFNFFHSRSIYERLWEFVLELKSLDLMNNELSWTSILEQGIDERFNVAEHLLQIRTIRVQEGFTKNRIDEIEQHKNLFAGHTKVISENLISHMYYITILIKKNKNRLGSSRNE